MSNPIQVSYLRETLRAFSSFEFSSKDDSGSARGQAYPQSNLQTGLARLGVLRQFVIAAIWLSCVAFSMSSLQAAGRQQLQGHVPQATANSDVLGRVPGSVQMSVAIGLPLRNEAELEAFLKQVSDPASPLFRHYLSPAQFAERFGPTEADYQALSDFMTSNGLTVSGTHPNRLILDVTGPVNEVERTFHVNMMRWHHSTRGTYFAPDREPSLDANVKVLDVSGLDNFSLPKPMDVKTLPLSQATPMATGSGQGGLLIGGDFRAAYAPGVTLKGSGQTIGLFELDGFYASDVQANFQKAGLPPVPVQTVLVGGFSGAPGGSNIEVILDIMMAAYMAPGVSNIIVYEGLNWNDVLNRMATDNLASQLSSSWCFSPTNATTEQIFKQFIAQGQTLFQASGDSGAYKGWVWSPADDPNVTVVGGTSLTTAGAGGPWQSETTWTGSGGGISTVWPIPSYQQQVNMAAAGGSTTMRNIPDVALTADVQMFLIQNNGQAVAVGGTSAAAPLWAGFMALVNQQAAASGKPAVGFLNPILYQLAGNANTATDLHDITTGNNKGFNALSGYDLATGLGTPAGQSLIDDLTGVTNPPGFTLAPSTASVSLAPGGSQSSTIVISTQNGFSGSVDLGVAGLPAGVTAAFSQPTATTASTLTLSASSSAAPGTSTVTVKGTSGTLSSTAPLTLTVASQPSFTLTATPASVSVAAGATVASSIKIVPQAGFSGAVTLSATGLPTGVTASFSAVSSGSSTLTLSAAATTALGSWNVVVKGVSGGLAASATVTLSVTAPMSFGLSASPAALSLAAGGTGATAVKVTAQNGFAGSVTLAASGLPAGVTALFSPSVTTGSSTLTLSASTSAVAGAATVTVTGTSGALRTTSTLTLTIGTPASFTLSASPTALNTTRGSSITTAVKVTPQNGFNGTVSLAASGLPAGVTAAFSPASTTSASTLTLTANASATMGAATITVTGTSGSLRSTATFSLVVAAAQSFKLNPSSASLTIPQGNSGASTLTISRQNGFTGIVNFSIAGLPAGVTAAFSPASSDRSTILTLSAASSASLGSATVTVTGVSGTLVNKLTMTVIVTYPPSFKLTAPSADGPARQGGGQAPEAGDRTPRTRP